MPPSTVAMDGRTDVTAGASTKSTCSAPAEKSRPLRLISRAAAPGWCAGETHETCVLERKAAAELPSPPKRHNNPGPDTKPDPVTVRDCPPVVETCDGATASMVAPGTNVYCTLPERAKSSPLEETPTYEVPAACAGVRHLARVEDRYSPRVLAPLSSPAGDVSN